MRKHLAFLCVLLAAPLAAQNDTTERGFVPAKSFAVSDFDSINLFNGNLVVAIPIGPSYPVSETLSYRLTLAYNGKLWDTEQIKEGTEVFDRVKPAPYFNAGLGWILSLGRMLGPNTPINPQGLWSYVAPDGSEHTFQSHLHSNIGAADPNFVYTTDGSYLRFRVATQEVEFPDGSIHRFDASGRIVGMRDRFGGSIDDVTITYPANAWKIMDRHGRTQQVNLDAQGNVGSVVFTAPGGGTATWTFGYHIRDSVVACPHAGSTPRFSASYLTNITLPAGAGSYSMPIDQNNLSAAAYNIPVLPPQPPHGQPDPAMCDNTSSLLRKVTVPTKGRYEWDYAAYRRPEPGADGRFCRTFFTNSLGVSARRKVDPFGVTGTWTYTPMLEGQVPGGPPPEICDGFGNPLYNQKEATTTVVDPLGHSTVNYFSVALQDEASPAWREHEHGLPFTHYTADSGGRFLSRRIFANGSAATFREHFVRYENDGVAGGAPGAHPRVASDRTVDFEAGGTQRFADVNRSGFDGLGHYRTETTGGNFESGNVRTSFTDWNPTRGTYQTGGGFVLPGVNEPWVLGTFKETRVTEGGTAVVQFCFDPATGALLRRRVLNGTSPGSADLLSVSTIAPTTGHRTREELFGGDLQTLAVAADLCSAALPAASVARTDFTYTGGVLATATPTDAAGVSLGFMTTDRTIDVRTGLPTSERDAAGVSLTYTYDALGRRTAEIPGAGEDARVKYTYTTAGAAKAHVVIQRTDNGTGTVERTREEVYVDGFGRVVEERRTMPGEGIAKRLSTYNGAGNLATRSEWGGGSSKSQFKFYDPLGRLGRVVAPDSKVTVFRYTGVRRKDTQTFVASTRNPGTGVVTETPSNSAEVYDRQGRLIHLIEPTGDDTSYFYDINHRLRQVNQGAQTRVFGWDPRGFLRSETHPELGPGTITYANYDALGNPGRRVRGGWTLETVYDRLGRPTKIEEIQAGGARRTWKEWAYGLGQTAGNRSAGKVITEKRYNYVVPPGGAVEAQVIVTESLSYGGRSGRVSAKATAINAGGMGWTQSFTWDELGNLASESYPQCTHANCTATALLARSQSYGYNRGMLVNVPAFADGITYHLNGLPATIDHANGVLDTIANDPKERPRPLSITTTGGSRNWPSGLYAYDAAGNLYAQGTDYFLYDSLSRITTSRLHDQPYDGGTEKKQSYSYDRYGNLLDVTTQVATGLPVTRTNATVATTNRLSLAGYDLAGNVTAWQGLSYGYDPFDSMRYGPNRVLIYGPGDERIWEFAYTNASDVNTWVETFTLRGLGGKVKREYRAAAGTGAGHWQVNRDHLHRGGELLATVLPQQGATYHYSLDHLGTPRLVTDQNAIKIAQHTYYPYGEEASNPNQDGERMKFTGHERDFGGAGTTDDLDYMHARYCSPMTGRFMSVDSVGGKPGVPQSWNRFAYGRGNPLKFVDPDGRDVAYKDASLQVFYEKAAARNYKVRAVLTAFAPGTGRNLTIEKGDPGKFSFDEPRAAVTNLTTVRSEVPHDQLDAAFKEGGDEAAVALMDAAPWEVKDATIIIGEKAGDFEKLHELGHVDEALRDTEGFLKNSEDADKATDLDSYKDSKSEQIADKFAEEAKKKQPLPP